MVAMVSAETNCLTPHASGRRPPRRDNLASSALTMAAARGNAPQSPIEGH